MSARVRGYVIMMFVHTEYAFFSRVWSSEYETEGVGRKGIGMSGRGESGS